MSGPYPQTLLLCLWLSGCALACVSAKAPAQAPPSGDVEVDADGGDDVELSPDAATSEPEMVDTSNEPDPAPDVSQDVGEDVERDVEGDVPQDIVEPDAGCELFFWPDTDDDGFGDPEGEVACDNRAGFVQNDSDCDDNDPLVNPDAEDRPDAEFTDANCDGFDGIASELVFVSKGGDDQIGAGTMRSPLKTISAGIAAASSTEGKSGVALGQGDYEEAVVLADGISLYGSYDPDDGWRRVEGRTTRILATEASPEGVIGLRAVDIAILTEVGHVSIEASGGGETSIYGVHALNAPALVLDHVIVSAGDAGEGSAGFVGGSGANGSGGASGGDCGGAAGRGGSSACGAPGGAGGFGGALREAGADGEPPGCGGDGGPRGGGGAGGDGQSGCRPGDGSRGSDATDSNSGLFDINGLWLDGSGEDGRAGRAGAGGGGGGGGGGAAVIGGRAGAGGGGGSGGCGGQGGGGGAAGAGSFAVVLVNSTGVQIIGSRLQSGIGGSGGDGGRGGVGGRGGAGGGGGSGRAAFACGGLAGPGAGGGGGRGADGGAGGHGRGGDGGPSYCVVCVSTSFSLGDNEATRGAGGQPGAGPGRVGVLGDSLRTFGCDDL